MDKQSADTLRDIVDSTSVASLGTLGPSGPLVSMVPVAIDGRRLIIHVSGLAAHTAQLRANARVSVMLMKPETAGANALALPRISFEAEAREIERDSEEYGEARALYLNRHPGAEMLFGFGDFALFELVIEGARFVAGFGAAFDVASEEIVEALEKN